MPSVNFVLPHWLYWLGLILFPLVAMYLARRAKATKTSDGHSLGTAYFVWVVGGFLGLHRLYLRNVWGLAFWPLFALILYSSGVERDARIVFSEARASLEVVEKSIARNERRAEKAEAAVEKTRADLAALAEDDRSRKRLERKLKREEKKAEDGRAKAAEIRGEVAGLEVAAKAAGEARERWSNWSLYALLAICAFLLFDLFRIPAMRRAADADLAANPGEPIAREVLADDSLRVGTGLSGLLDRISLWSGEYVAFWSIIAVFVYYYEVVVRYVFNSPTNWAHEGMFLMFGMQYLVAGAYAMLTESHVRVDIFYAKFSQRGKAFVDLLTSVFFFIFAGTLLATGWTFASDAIGQNEVSFTEWAVHYWPVKCVIVLGGALLILQGISKVLKDAAVVFGGAQASAGEA